MNDRNHWITFVNDIVVRWGAFLPAPRGDVDALVRFGVSVVEAGARHEVYRALRIPAAQAYVAGDKNFEDYLRAQANERGRVPLFPGDHRPGPELWAPARIAFYRDEEIVEEEVGDVGALLRELRPDKIESARMFMRSASPVSVMGKSVDVNDDREVRVQVRLDTDIWFPRVMGMLEDMPEDELKPDFFNNRELAERHTPRLNLFLNELRECATALGGRWEVLEVDGIGVNYADQWDALGIHL
jgi:hypothetical protein